MHAITPRLFSKDVYSVPLRALRLRGGGGVPKCFQMYKKFSGHIIIFPKIQLFSKFTFSCPENDLNSPENLLQIYLNLTKSALDIYLKFLMSNYQGCCTPPPPPVSFKQTFSDLLIMYFTSQNILHHTLEHFAVVMLKRGSNL
jgi:hypothetical protein